MPSRISSCLRNPIQQQGTFSEKDEQLRQIIAKLDAIGPESSVSSLTTEDVTQIRRQLAEDQSLVRETVERLRQKQEESDLITRRKDELESRLSTLEAEYEELLGAVSRPALEHIDLLFPRENHTRRRI